MSQKKIQTTPLNKFKMTGDNVLLEAIDIDEEDGVFTPSQYDEKPMFAKVLAVGPGAYTLDGGAFIPTTVKVGDYIMFGRYASDKIRHMGKEYLLIKEIDIKAIL